MISHSLLAKSPVPFLSNKKAGIPESISHSDIPAKILISFPNTLKNIAPFLKSPKILGQIKKGAVKFSLYPVVNGVQTL